MGSSCSAACTYGRTVAAACSANGTWSTATGACTREQQAVLWHVACGMSSSELLVHTTGTGTTTQPGCTAHPHPASAVPYKGAALYNMGSVCPLEPFTATARALLPCSWRDRIHLRLWPAIQRPSLDMHARWQ